MTLGSYSPFSFLSGKAAQGWFLVATTCISILMTWIYVNANGNYLVAGFIPHAVNNLMATSQAFIDIKFQALVYAAICVLIVAWLGPSLKGWRSAKTVTAGA